MPNEHNILKKTDEFIFINDITNEGNRIFWYSSGNHVRKAVLVLIHLEKSYFIFDVVFVAATILLTRR